MIKYNVEVRYLKNARRGTIRVLAGGIVRVTVPRNIGHDEVQRILHSKMQWIHEKLHLLESLRSQEKPILYQSGSVLPYQGQELQLKLIEGYGPATDKEGVLIVPVSSSEVTNEEVVKEVIVNWYKAKAILKIQERVQYYSIMLNVLPRSVSLKNYKSRWGACSSQGDLFFNWQIIAFEPRLFDYVIAHELCHLKEMNHSKKFYRLLSGIGFEKRDIHQQFKNLKNIF